MQSTKMMFLAIMLCLSLMTTIMSSNIVKAEAEIKYLTLPSSNSMPMGITYDSSRNVVWVALYWNRSIAKIDVVTKDVTLYPLSWYVGQEYYGPMPWTIAIDGNNDLWISIRSYMVTPNHPPSTIPYLAKMNLNNETFTIFWIPAVLAGGCDIKYHNGYVWYQTNNALSKINYTTNSIVESYIREFSGGFIKPDNECLWLSSVSGDFVTRFNILTNKFDLNLTGFDRPLGIEADSKYVYVAENARLSEFETEKMGHIARINKTDYTIARLNTTTITNEGPYHVYKDSFGYLWFTDSSQHLGIVGGTVWTAISPLCYFITEVPTAFTEIWFSCVGSAYIGIKTTGTLGKTDINMDGKVDIKDIAIMAKAFGSYPGSTNWDPIADITGPTLGVPDNKVDSYDIAFIAKNYGKTL